MRLKELRNEKKISQYKLADDLNLNVMTYNGWEKGKVEPSIENLKKLADFYGVSLDYLVGRDFGNGLGYLNEIQLQFVKTFLSLNQANQMNAVVYVATLLANQ